MPDRMRALWHIGRVRKPHAARAPSPPPSARTAEARHVMGQRPPPPAVRHPAHAAAPGAVIVLLDEDDLVVLRLQPPDRAVELRVRLLACLERRQRSATGSLLTGRVSISPPVIAGKRTVGNGCGMMPLSSVSPCRLDAGSVRLRPAAVPLRRACLSAGRVLVAGEESVHLARRRPPPQRLLVLDGCLDGSRPEISPRKPASICGVP